ncbi:hypothetical protein D9611_010121 [Ephemerocybe angulata]|uniref:Uncharacterized protein n=1 Tax=Ephemerocybe angulata TaxID=980116 RepID=A0A8H5AZ71_9AGAR|nr:hypothetical protein D9611_010121 [Tulosesus angulatus]
MSPSPPSFHTSRTPFLPSLPRPSPPFFHSLSAFVVVGPDCLLLIRARRAPRCARAALDIETDTTTTSLPLSDRTPVVPKYDTQTRARHFEPQATRNATVTPTQPRPATICPEHRSLLELGCDTSTTFIVYTRYPRRVGVRIEWGGGKSAGTEWSVTAVDVIQQAPPLNPAQ